MLGLGIILGVVGFALLTPGGGTSDVTQRRMMRFGVRPSHPLQSGREAADVGRRRRVIEIVIALALMALGAWCVARGLSDSS